MTGERAGYANMASSLWSSSLSATEREHLAGLLEAQTQDPFLRAVARRSLELMRIGPGARVIDVGCGTGVLLPALAELVGRTGKVVGLDYSPELLAKARERVRDAGYDSVVELVEGDAAQLPFESGAYDAAHVERVLIHLLDADAALREMRRVVRPGGWVVAAEPDNGGVRIDHANDPEGMAMLLEFEMRQLMNPAMGLELNRRLASAGLGDREIIAMTEFVDSYDEAAAAVDRETVAAAAAAGIFSSERGEAVVSYLLAAAARGEYAWLGTMVIAAGRVPTQDP